MRILVTGGAGFIGSHVAENFSQQGHQVVILDNLSTGRRENIPDGVEFVEGDITDKALVDKLFTEHAFEVVNHHAAQMDIRHSVEDPAFDAQVNIIGIITLLQAAARVGTKKFMFASTGGAIYGEQDYFPADENHPTNPISPYGISKLAGEKYLYYYHVQHGIKIVVMRYANVYGPRQNPFGEAGVLAIFSHLLVQGKQVTINGDGLQTRDYIYIGDVVQANALALDWPGSITFNVGTGKETNVITLYKYLAEAAETDLAPLHGPAKPGEQQRSVISHELATKTLSWKPEMALQEGIALTYRSFVAK
ncbi:MAG: NAD-dependent epimerase/dehydratase family protein [Fidelibacterota bacterium]|nr:MAG: NAD-dependent epimerase/dehydratase family protein [Candidatus Neomarinimicrobiota bacterium]